MFITQELADRRLLDPSNLANRFQAGNLSHLTIDAVKRKRADPVLKGIRDQVALELLTGSTQLEVCEEFGITKAQASQVSREVNRDDKFSEMREVVQNTAFNKLLVTLGFMTDDKLSGASIKDLSTVAANMSRVVEKMNPQQKGFDGVQVHIYAPEVKQIQDYKVVDI